MQFDWRRWSDRRRRSAETVRAHQRDVRAAVAASCVRCPHRPLSPLVLQLYGQVYSVGTPAPAVPPLGSRFAVRRACGFVALLPRRGNRNSTILRVLYTRGHDHVLGDKYRIDGKKNHTSEERAKAFGLRPGLDLTVTHQVQPSRHEIQISSRSKGVEVSTPGVCAHVRHL